MRGEGRRRSGLPPALPCRLTTVLPSYRTTLHLPPALSSILSGISLSQSFYLSFILEHVIDISKGIFLEEKPPVYNGLWSKSLFLQKTSFSLKVGKILQTSCLSVVSCSYLQKTYILQVGKKYCSVGIIFLTGSC